MSTQICPKCHDAEHVKQFTWHVRLTETFCGCSQCSIYWSIDTGIREMQEGWEKFINERHRDLCMLEAATALLLQDLSDIYWVEPHPRKPGYSLFRWVSVSPTYGRLRQHVGRVWIEDGSICWSSHWQPGMTTGLTVRIPLTDPDGITIMAGRIMDWCENQLSQS